ncbi:hypothetical protein ACQPYA_03835 [Micromonospora sp. CA-263727]|uniref:hypothetical protein n=1 Tax=Micromonospora sp. CA-263727 TaxID=3239967 RepID=UPI003D929E14
MTARVTVGRLWSEDRNWNSAAHRSIVVLDGDQVTTMDVDHDPWQWRPALRSWGVGDVAQVEQAGRYGLTTPAALGYRHYVLVADPSNVGRVLPADAPVQGTLFDPPTAVA